MDKDIKTYLLTQIFSEQKTLSYRSVSRALKVHVNTAKRILYEFHAHENGKKPGSVQATYLLAGTKREEAKQVVTNGHVNGVGKDDDEPMPSSPPPFTSSMLQSSQPEGDGEGLGRRTFPITSITLVREESLDGKSGGRPGPIRTKPL